MPHGHWKTITFTRALLLTGMTAPFIYDGAMNGNVFLGYVEQILVPSLSAGDVVVRDNLPAHKFAGARDAIETAGARLLHLPPYIQSRLQPDRKRILETQGASGEPGPSEPSKLCWTHSPPFSTSSPQSNVPTTSRRLDMNRT